MFGLSLAELLVICLVALIFIKPQDLPEIAHFIGKVIFRARRTFSNFKKHFKEIENDLGIEEIKHEINRGIAEEKSKLEELETTIIVDIHGNEHVVHNVHELRSDLSKDEMQQEIQRLNDENISNKTNQNQTPDQKTNIS